jgi:hypothetical protein
MDVNIVVKRYAAGEVTKAELKDCLDGLGYSPDMVAVLLRRADHKKRIFDQDEASGIDTSKFFLSTSEIYRSERKPSGSLGDEAVRANMLNVKGLSFIVQSHANRDEWGEVSGSDL